MSGATTMARPPRLWKYLLWSLIAIAVLVPLCTVVSGYVLVASRPELVENDDVIRRLLAWSVALPVIAVGLFGGWRWHMASSQAQAAQAHMQQATAAQTDAQAAGQQARREYVLEVIGLGVTLDKYRQGKLWDALSKGHSKASIREQDPKKYPWAANDKDGQSGGRANDAMENGAKLTPMYWGVPTFRADSPALQGVTSPTSPASVAGDPEGSGMAFHLFVAAGWELSERPDRLMDRVFRFFDEHPDVPYVVVSAADDPYFRNLYRPKGTPPLVKDGYYIPEMPDSSALLVLARRERVDAIRPFAFEDVDEDKYNGEELNRHSFSRKLMVAYMDLAEKVPKPEGQFKRTPTVAEWLQETQAFTQRDDIYPRGISNAFAHLTHGKPSIPKDFKPTPWFPIPWNTVQLAAFDKLPTLGFIHRPVFVKTVDEHGQPLSRRDARAAALAAGWKAALDTLPETERKTAPARVVTATGGNIEQTIALHSVLNTSAEQGGPELDSAKATQWIDTDSRLGNTGAATWFVQMAIGVIGSYREGGATAAINLRDPSEASIVFITPPSADKRKNQHNAQGGDVLRSIVGPAVDPANYQQ